MGAFTEITVGQDGGDVTGSTNAAIQAAVDRAASNGGGCVHILPGTYRMDDSLHLRSGVTVRGSGEKTVLLKPPSKSSAVTCYLGYGHYDVSVQEPELFPVGTGIHILDNETGGFYSTVATVNWRRGSNLGLSRMLNADCNPRAGGRAVSVYPVVSGCDVTGVEVRDLAIEGNGGENEHLNGCRGGGIFLLHAQGAHVANVVVRGFNGDGISFQACRGVVVNGCVCEGNTGHGMHPGSGSVGAAISNCLCAGNGQDGVFFCLRVSFSTLTNCVIRDNRGRGISIGHRDCNLALTNNRIINNSGAGIYFRSDPWSSTGLDTLVQGNALQGNGLSDGGQILFDSSTHGAQILANSFECGRNTELPHILINHPQKNLVVYGNDGCGHALGYSDNVSYEKPDRAPVAGTGCIPDGSDLHLCRTDIV